MSKFTKIWAVVVTASVALIAACSGDAPTTTPTVMVSRAGLPLATDASSTQTWSSVNPVCTGTRGVTVQNGNGNGGGTQNIVGLGYLGGFKIDGTNLATAVATTVPVPGLGTITYTTNGGRTGLVSWSSTFPIDAVLMKGGNGAIEYLYANGATIGAASGTGGFDTPNNPNGNPAGISHINFCWYGRFGPGRTPEPGSVGFMPVVTGRATYTRDYQWAIAKTASAPASITTGGSVTVNYAVTMTRSTQTETAFGINGVVTVTNPEGYGTSGAVDGVTVDVGGVTATVTNCPTFPATLAPGASLTCDYTATLPDKTPRTVTATAHASGLWRSTTASSGVSFGDPTTELDASATVTDTRTTFANGGVVNGTTTFSYTMSFGPYTACVPVDIPNTASFVSSTSGQTGSHTASTTTSVTGCSTDGTEVGTAFAYDPLSSVSFRAASGGSIKRWGWNFRRAAGAPTAGPFPVYVGSPYENPTGRGTQVGTVTIDFTGGTARAVYALNQGYGTSSTHLYVGTTPLPKDAKGKWTVAPGQYRVDVNGTYIIAHAVITYRQP